MSFIVEPLPSEPYERALLLKNLLVQRATGGGGGPQDEATYAALRREFTGGPKRDLLPSYLRTCRDLDTFWPVAKEMSPTYAGRRLRIAQDFAPLLDALEGRPRSPLDEVAASVLTAFDAEGVRSAWEKALKRREEDPEGAITAARTLLETVCKHVLEEESVHYGEADDLPKLYRLTSETLNIAPAQHTEEAFKRILGGGVSVVEGLGSLRNRIGDAHGTGRRPVRPAARHAQLAVNLAGTMAVFIVETWAAQRAT